MTLWGHIRRLTEAARKAWNESLAKHLHRTTVALVRERREHLASRQEIHALEREREAKELSIQSQSKDPLSEAKRLLRLIEEIAEPIYVRSGQINNYELRCWMDDYRQFKLENQR